MPDLNPFNWWRRLLALPNDNLTKTLVIAFLVIFTASIIVSFTAVTLRPFHVANLEKERQASLSAIIASLPGMDNILADAGVNFIEIHVVDLASGEFATTIDPTTFDQREAARDPTLSSTIPAEADVAGIKRREDYAQVFILRKDDDIQLVVLPVRGVGYQSMLYAYLALEADINTIAGLTFYEQGETPGIGARIEEAEWLALWPGKQLADENGEIKISVVRDKAVGPFEVDGISGATRTSNGISNMLHFWLGDYGFGPFLAKLRASKE
ncbi:MAG: Na(+)-translocating NADH-quinone reductase subunit C [Devosiaceae bacterium]|nr:Na(+)-translocating NADH-quinone reductase subunit C [Devosiaceae bacterium]